MNTILKKGCSLLVAAVMTAALSPAVMAETAASAENPSGSGLYPDASYTTAASELDSTGAWKYRELVPDVGCEEENSLMNRGAIYPVQESPSKQTNAMRVSTEKHTGSYSWYRRAYYSRGIGFKLDPGIIEYDQKYISSAWLRSDMEGINGQDTSGVHMKMFANAVTTEMWLNSASASISKTWKKYDLSFTAPSAGTYDTAKNFYIGIANVDASNETSYCETRTDNGAVRPVYSLYVDDWSMRRAIPDDFPNSYTKSITPSQSNPSVQNGDKVIFTFSLDIDPRTVRRENITVNKKAGSENISAVNVTTDENTRETRLEIELNNLSENGLYQIELPELKDAWGRNVIGANSITVCRADIPEGAYTIFDELDSSGNWAYRNLIPDEECETIDGFWDNNATPNKGETNIGLSTDAHSGNYSISRTMSGFGRLGAKVDTLDIQPEEYVLRVWAKADLNEKAGDSISLVPCYDVYQPRATSITGTPFAYPNVDVSIPINENWGYYTKKLRIPSATIPEIDKTKDTYIHFYANKKVDGKALINTIYVDDWSFRKLPSWNVYATGVSVNGNKAVFTFDKDIDKWSVTADKILVNGVANTGKITDAVVETDEITRKTTLTVTASETIDDNFVVSLPETAKDAWYREIRNKVETGLSLGKAQITDGSGSAVTDVTKLTAGETYNYRVTGIINGASDSADISALLALYDGDGKCVSVDIDRASFVPGSTGGCLEASVTVPTDGTDYTLKPFIWDVSKLSPYEKPLKVLLIGNSYTYHTPDTSKGWIGNWGMAASSADKDYVHILTEMLHNDSKNIEVRRENISNIEKDFTQNGIDTCASTYYQDSVDFDADVIIATFGANIKDVTWEDDSGYENTLEFTKSDYKNIIDKFNPGGDAVVIAGDTLKAGTDLNNRKKAAIKGAADDNGYIYVALDDIITAFPAKAEYTENPDQYKNAFTEPVNAAVLAHPGDTGMRYLANRLYVKGIINAFQMLGMNYTSISELEMPAN